MQYDEGANGTEITAHVNEEFEIVLSETRTAGYRWSISESGEPVLQLIQEVSLPNAGAVGGSAQRRWQFRAAAPGETEIKVRYARSWEKPSEPTRTFVLKVRVQS